MLPVNYCLDILQGLFEQANWSPQRCVRLLDIENDMRFKGSEELEEIERRCCGFLCFMNYCIRTEHVYNAFYERFGYGFVVMEADDFYRNGFDGYECNHCHSDDPLFLLVGHNKYDSQEHKSKKMASLRLENELFKFYEDNAMTQKTVQDRNLVIEKIEKMIGNVWPDLEFTVEYFGSTRTHLASNDSDLDITVVIPGFANRNRKELKRLKQIRGSIFHMNSLASELRNIGMVNILSIQNANVPICKFTDAQTGLQCDISASSTLGLENSQLINDYRKLDTRVGPFLYALKYFVKQRHINDNQMGTLSSYAYCLLGIYYLMNYNHDSPILPNLQNLTSNCDDCNGLGCKFGNTSYFVENQQVRYHDCIKVVSESRYQSKKEAGQPGSATTQWDSYCLDNLGEIMLSFFQWASKLDNLTKHMSIRFSPFGIPNPNPKWFENSIVIQDPFILSKNVAQSCSEQGLNRIQLQFERAARLLEETSMTFEEICNSTSDPQLTNNYRSMTAKEIPLNIKQPINKRNRNRIKNSAQNHNNQGFKGNSDRHQNKEFVSFMQT